MNELKTLFKKCLGASYTHTAADGDYAIELEDDTLYLLFEWSDGKEDWKNNFRFPAKPYKHMEHAWFCHGGFLKVWKAMRTEIEDKVAELLSSHSKIGKVVCVGYSHGSALAVLATEDMEYIYGKSYEVSGYGFGAPRVLWGIVPEDVKKRLRRFTSVRNIPDLVTHVPPMLFGFRNAGTLVKIGKTGKYSPIKAHYDSAYITELNAMEGVSGCQQKSQ